VQIPRFVRDDNRVSPGCARLSCHPEERSDERVPALAGAALIKSDVPYTGLARPLLR